VCETPKYCWSDIVISFSADSAVWAAAGSAGRTDGRRPAGAAPTAVEVGDNPTVVRGAPASDRETVAIRDWGGDESDGRGPASAGHATVEVF